MAFDDWADALENSCAVCQRDTDEARAYRKKWGCDEDQSEEDWNEAGGLAIEPCIFCEGRDPDCPDCAGENLIVIKRCPWSMITAAHRELVQLSMLVEFGHLPGPGGWLNQPAVFVAAWNVIQSEKARIDSAKRKTAENRAAAARATAKRPKE